MKKILLFIGVSFLVLGSPVVFAQMTAEEEITSFSSQLTVHTDNSADVVETIKYSTGATEHHGIYRDIYPYSSTGELMHIEQISVTDEAGTAYPYTTSYQGKYLRIKIGDPHVTFIGKKTYIIHYLATHAVAHLKDIDEIYWNATGNNWSMPIGKAHATIILPKGAERVQMACYYGDTGSTDRCDTSLSDEYETYTFDAPTMLGPGEGLTAAVGFKKGIVTPYPATDSFVNFMEQYLSWMLAGLLPILTFIFSFRYWYKYGRDPKGTGVIVPEYDVPDQLTPMEIAGIVRQRVRSSDIPAEIIYLATQGYLTIHQSEETTLGFIKRTEYEFTKRKDFSDIPNEHDKILLEGLFKNGASTVLFSSQRNSFYTTIKKVNDAAVQNLLTKGYYKNVWGMKYGGSSVAGLLVLVFLGVWLAIFFGSAIGALFFRGNVLPFIVSIFTSIMIYGIIAQFFPAKTEKGVATKEYILGLKDYLQIAEKDRLQFHNAPEKKPEVFEALLPFAMVLGVTEIWAKEFADIYTTPPEWYSSSHPGTFNALVLSNSLSHFSTATTQSLSSSPGGSGGGGFAGGGGGGGGGGSW